MFIPALHVNFSGFHGNICQQRTQFFKKGVHLLGASANVALRLQNRFHLLLCHSKFTVICQAGEQVAGLTLFHTGRGLHGATADDFVELLAVSSTLDSLHQKVFGGNEGEIFPHFLLYDFFIDVETVRDISCQA